MQAMSDEQQIERVEARVDRLDLKLETQIDRLDRKIETQVGRLDQKMEAGFAEIRGEMRANFHTLLAILLPMLVAMILGFAGILLQHHL
jgi:chromosome segregation ATPase